MNKITLLWEGTISRNWTEILSLPWLHLKAIRIHAPKSMQNSCVTIHEGGNYLVEGKLWWFEGGLIPIDLDTNRECEHGTPNLSIENPTTRSHRVSVIIVTEG